MGKGPDVTNQRNVEQLGKMRLRSNEGRGLRNTGRTQGKVNQNTEDFTQQMKKTKIKTKVDPKN